MGNTPGTVDNQNVLPAASDINARHWVDVIHGPFVVWAILLISIVITIAAWHLSTKYADERARDRFEFKVDDAVDAIKRRMLDYEQMLRGGVGLFEANHGHVTRLMWRQYVATLALDKHYRGVQGVGFSLWIPVHDLPAHIASVRAEGFPEYTVKPIGERPEYTSIIYLEPFSDRNLRAFGFDMFSESTRREAMIRARDTGLPALSGRVTLKQETSKDVQQGFLVYLPVYKKPAQSLAERQSELLGFVYSPFRVGDLMSGILGAGSPELTFEIYDGKNIDSQNLLYDSKINAPEQKRSATENEFTQEIIIGGHTWTVHFAPTVIFDQINTTSQPLLVALGGIVIDIMLFFIIMSLARLRNNAVQIAKMTALQLDKTEHHFKAIADTANDGIVSADSNGLISYFNKGAERIFGYDAGAVLGKPITLLMPDRHHMSHQHDYDNFIRFGERNIMGRTVEMCGHRSDGTEFPLELSLSHWKVGDDQYVNAIIRDITERKKMERIKNEFISTVSHELRTPLTSIRGSLLLISGGVTGEISPKARELLDIANVNIERLTRLINDILDIDKIESGELTLSVRSYDGESLLQQSISENRGSAHQKDVDLALEPVPHVLIDVDKDRFLQIMTNLISNAIEFSQAEQKVTVRTSIVRDRLRIQVEDQGPGIPEEFRSRIFGKFAQADSSDTRLKGGTGLGLSICKALVEKFGGQIGYTSAVGVGTTFYFDLPCSSVG